MAQNYSVNAGGVCQTRDVVMTTTSCVLYSENIQNNGEYNKLWQQILTFTLNSVLTVPVIVHFKLYVTEQEYATIAYQGWEYKTITIPAGSLSITYQFYCNQESREDFGAGGISLFTRIIDSPTLLPQLVIPDVCIQQGGGGYECTMALTEVDIIKPTVRGGNDGSIDASFSGASGLNVNVYLNGVFQGLLSGGNGVNFPDLIAGSYTILFEDEEGCLAQGTYVIQDGEFRTGDFNVTLPKDLTCTENPIVLSLSTKINTSSPTYPQSTITLGQTINDGDSIVINLEYPQTYSAKFTAKYFPNREDYFLASVLKNNIGISVGSNSINEIATSITEVLRKDVVISRLYDIRTINQTIILTANEANSNLNLNNTNVIIDNSNLSINNNVIGITQYDGQLSQNYSLYSTIYVNTNLEYGDVGNINDYEFVSTIELPFSPNNKHYFDLAPILKNFVSTPKLDFSVTGFTTLAPMISSYIVEYGEKYPLIQNETTKKARIKGITLQKFCMNSALNWTNANDMSNYLGSAAISPIGWTTDVKFLTTQPKVKQVQRNSTEYLFFLLPKDYGKTLEVKADLFFYDGSSLLSETLYSITSLGTNFGGVFCVAAGYNELNLKSYEVVSGLNTKKIRRVDFAVWQTIGIDSIPYTETLSYRYEIDEQPRKYGVAFLNKVGTWSIFDFSGEIINDIVHSNEKMEVSREISLLGSSPKGFQANTVYDTKVTKTIACNSGWVDEAHFNWLIELLSSHIGSS